jgi:hypothetical protein
MPSTLLTVATSTTNGHAPRRHSTACVLAHRLLDRAAELAGFLDGAVLPPDLELEVAAGCAAADGLLARAVGMLEAAGPG